MSILRGKNQNYYEKSLKLDDIPGLFTINKIKPKELKKINSCDKCSWVDGRPGHPGHS